MKTFIFTFLMLVLMCAISPASAGLFNRNKKKEDKVDKDKQAMDDIRLGMQGVANAAKVRLTFSFSFSFSSLLFRLFSFLFLLLISTGVFEAGSAPFVSPGALEIWFRLRC